MPKGDSHDYLSAFTLRFRYPEIEERYRLYKEDIVQGSKIAKIIIIAAILAIGSILVLGSYYHDTENTTGQFAATFWTVLVLYIGIAVEFTLHCFPRLHCLRSFAITVAAYFAAVYYALNVMPVPALSPGYARDTFS